jgi:hypothetical protein
MGGRCGPPQGLGAGLSRPSWGDDCFLFLAHDNDFATTDDFPAGAACNDGKDLDTMFLS